MCIACHLRGRLDGIEGITHEDRIKAHHTPDWQCVRHGVCIDCGVEVGRSPYDQIWVRDRAGQPPHLTIDHMCQAELAKQIDGPRRKFGRQLGFQRYTDAKPPAKA